MIVIRQLETPRIRKNPDSKYPYTLVRDWPLKLAKDCGHHDFRDAAGRVWLEFRGTIAIVKEGYSWNGASCAPDFESVIPASAAHDAFCQFLNTPCFPLTKAEVDRAFLDLMPRGFVFRHVYWAAVRAFGGVYARFSGSPDPTSCGLPHGR